MRKYPQPPDRFPAVTETEITWTASWGDQVKPGDLLRVKQLGGAVRVVAVRKFLNPPVPGPVVQDEDSRGFFFGIVVEDALHQQFHHVMPPHEAVYIGLETPATKIEQAKEQEDDDTA